MLTIISGTNRPNSKTLLVSKKIESMVQSLWTKTLLLSLEELNNTVILPDMYTESGQESKLAKLQDDYILPAKQLLIVLPEYNGTMPGILKYFIDAISVRSKDDNFRDKHVAFVGVSSGRAGNLRGLDQLTNALNYLGMHVYRDKLPISLISSVVDENGELNDATTKALTNLLSNFAKVSNAE